MKINSIRLTEPDPQPDNSTSLGIGRAKPLQPFSALKPTVPDRMITTESDLKGFLIESHLGVVDGVAEISMAGVKIPHLEMHAGGKLKELVAAARGSLARAAADLGADAVIGFRYVFSGRDYEKSVLAFGTAVICTKLKPNTEVAKTT